MGEHDTVAELLIEASKLREAFRLLAYEHFELRQKHFSRNEWWTKAGAGSSQELAGLLHTTLAGERSGLADYWYYPSGKHNPYLDLLYSDMAANGMRVRELPTFADLALLPSGSTLHLHWIESLRPNGSDRANNREALDKARNALEVFVSDPANTLIWSVHEPLPHGSNWPEDDTAFHQFLADTAHLVHVLHDATAELCSPYFTIDPAKTATIKLPLYSGVYPDFRTRDNARALLGIAQDELCVVFVGAIRSYKGIDQLLDAAANVPADRKLRLLIGGMPVEDHSELAARIDDLDWVTMAPMLVPDSEIQTMLRAADLLAVPYQRFLNSAVLMLGLSFGVPVVASDNPVTRDATASGLVTVYREPDELTAALAAAKVAPTGELDTDFARQHAPYEIARSFATAVRDALRGSATPQ